MTEAPARPKARIVVKDLIYHQVHGEQPTVMELPGFTRALKTDEQLWSRKQTVGPEWTALDIGWFKDQPCGMLVIENLEGHFLQTQPTDEERAAVEVKVVELCLSGIGIGDDGSAPMADVLLPVRETCRFQPNDLRLIGLRCPTGPAKVQVTIFPA